MDCYGRKYISTATKTSMALFFNDNKILRNFGEELIDTTPEKDRNKKYKLKNPGSDKDIIKKLITDDINCDVVYNSITGEQINHINANLFSGLQKISGPISLYKVERGGKVYLFFGDLHFSNAGLCNFYDGSIELTDFVKTISKVKSSVAGVSKAKNLKMDVFSEINDSGSDIFLSKKFPLNRFLYNNYTCFINQYKGWKETEEYYSDCGENVRYHWVDLRFIFPEADLTSLLIPNMIDKISVVRMFKTYKNSISSLGEVYFDIDHVIQYNLAVNGISQESINEDGKNIMTGLLMYEIVNSDNNFTEREKRNLFFKFMNLDDSFHSIFEKKIPEKGENQLNNLIINQISNISDIQIVINIFNFLIEDFFTFFVTNWEKSDKYLVRCRTIYQILSYDEKETNLFLNKYYDKTSLRRVSTMKTEEDLMMIKYEIDSMYIKYSNISKYIEKLLSNKDPKFTIDIKIKRVKELFVLITLDEEGFTKPFIPIYTLFMDLYCLLRMERTFSKKRTENPDYFNMRPIEPDTYLFYGGDFHSERYAKYFQYFGGERESYYTDEKFNSLEKYKKIDEVSRDNGKIRCLDLKYNIISLLLPKVPYENIDIIIRN